MPAPVLSSALASVSALLLAACGAASGTGTHPSEVASAGAGFPIATSSGSGATSWVVVPMGDVGTLRNTFWQLFVDRNGHGLLRLATPPGVADNGGLVVSGGAGRRGLQVGVFTSQLLGFSPIAASQDGGLHWSGSVLPGELTPVPDALSAASTGPATALLGRDGARVVDGPSAAGSSASARWTTVTTLAALRHLAPPSCDLGALTAVTSTGSAGSAGTATVFGGACRHGGEVALFVNGPGGWRFAGGRLSGTAAAPAATSAATSTAVVSVWPAGNGHGSALALVLARGAAAGSGSGRLVAVRLGSVLHARTTAVAALPIPAGATIRAIGEAPGGGAVVLVAGGSPADPSHERVELLDAGTGAWQALPAPPERTLGVLAERGGAVEALVVQRSSLDVYRLAQSAARWISREVERVPIAYGSSG